MSTPVTVLVYMLIGLAGVVYGWLAARFVILPWDEFHKDLYICWLCERKRYPHGRQVGALVPAEQGWKQAWRVVHRRCARRRRLPTRPVEELDT